MRWSYFSATYPRIALNVSSYFYACSGPIKNNFPFNTGFEPLKFSMDFGTAPFPSPHMFFFLRDVDDDDNDEVIVDIVDTVSLVAPPLYSVLVVIIMVLVLLLWPISNSIHTN